MKKYTTKTTKTDTFEVKDFETNIPDAIVKTIHNSLFELEVKLEEGVTLVSTVFPSLDDSSVSIDLKYDGKLYGVEITSKVLN